MMKIIQNILIRFLFIYIPSCILAYNSIAIDIRVAEIFFTVGGIFFSVGLSLLTSFDFSKIVNDDFYQKLLSNIQLVRKSFIFHFFISTICIAILYFIQSNSIVIPVFFSRWYLNIKNISIFCMIYTLINSILNFKTMAEMKENIDRRIHEEQKRNKNTIMQN